MPHIPVLIYPALQQPVLTPAQITPVSVSAFYAPFGLPVWSRKMHASRVPYLFLDPFPRQNPIPYWYYAWSEPVRERVGLRSIYQLSFVSPPRVLPTPDVTVVINATETNNDVALFGVVVYDNPGPTPGNAGAAVTIIELPAQDDAGISIREP